MPIFFPSGDDPGIIGGGGGFGGPQGRGTTPNPLAGYFGSVGRLSAPAGSGFGQHQQMIRRRRMASMFSALGGDHASASDLIGEAWR